MIGEFVWEGDDLIWSVFGELILEQVSAEIGLIVDVTLVFDVVMNFRKQPK